MPKVIVTPNPMYNPIGVRQLLAEMGVIGPMLQDETTIKCVMTEDQISRFRNSRGAAHQVTIVPDPPPVVACDPFVEVFDEQESDNEPPPTDPTTPEFPNAGGSDSSDDSDPDPKKVA